MNTIPDQFNPDRLVPRQVEGANGFTPEPAESAKPAPEKVDPAEPIETKREKFERIASYRVNKVLLGIERLETIGANASNYDYSEEDVERIIGTLTKAVDKLEVVLLPRSKRETRAAFRFG